MHFNFRDEDFILRVFGIDNGTSQLGLSMMEYDLRTGVGNVVHIEAYNPGDDAYDKYPYVNERRGAARARIRRTRDWFRDRLEEFDPHVVGCESPFSHLHPPAYAALLLSMDSLEEVCGEYNPSMDFVRVPPGSAKKGILHSGLKYDNDKEFIRKTLISHPYITTTFPICLALVSADESDSVAVGYCVAKYSNTLQR